MVVIKTIESVMLKDPLDDTTQDKITFREFINDFTCDNAIPLIEQITQSITDKNPSLLYEFHIDYNTLPKDIRAILFEEQDFAVFSRKFGDEVKKIISE